MQGNSRGHSWPHGRSEHALPVSVEGRFFDGMLWPSSQSCPNQSLVFSSAGLCPSTGHIDMKTEAGGCVDVTPQQPRRLPTKPTAGPMDVYLMSTTLRIYIFACRPGAAEAPHVRSSAHGGKTDECGRRGKAHGWCSCAQ